jgi:hypothetical protein
VLIALAALMKILALWVGLPMLWLAWRRDGTGCLRRPALWAMAAAILLPVAGWYAWSVRTFDATGLTLMGDWRYGSDKWGDWDLAFSGAFWNRIVFQRLAEKHLTWPGFVIFAAGLLLRRHHREACWDVCLLGVVIVTLVVARGAWHHEHYQLPFTIPAAMTMGRAFARGFRKRFWLSWRAAALAPLLVATVLAGGWRYLQMSTLEMSEDNVTWRLASLIRTHTRPGDPVVAVDGNDPTVLYHAGRRGWVASAETLLAGRDALLRPLIARGAAYLGAPYEHFLADNRTAGLRALRAAYPVAADDGAVFLLRLRSSVEPVAPGRAYK